MASFIAFVVVAALPLLIYFISALNSARADRGIAAGIPKPKEAKAPKAPRAGGSRSRDARVRQRRSAYCGRDFTHFALALVGSQDSCRHCTYLQEVPPPPPPGVPDDEDSGADSEAAVRAAEEIIDRANQ